ncbi:hypothetical protein CEXT_640951 [Caerostris extrusa]|uniref:Uncharacterized protein n=1 Tax=Caerostris extrusa TaxID=172846 RepID=A0AAV4MY45_CAEEX|nr:hypothetical protein CEXT_640951 [Caerostris extrusa]
MTEMQKEVEDDNSSNVGRAPQNVVARNSEVETRTSQSCHIPIGGFEKISHPNPSRRLLRNHSPEKGAHVTSSENDCLRTYFCDDVSLGKKWPKPFALFCLVLGYKSMLSLFFLSFHS